MIAHDRTRLIGRLSFFLDRFFARPQRPRTRFREPTICRPKFPPQIAMLSYRTLRTSTLACNFRISEPAGSRGNSMSTPQELEGKLWDALGSDRVVMLGLDGAENGHTRPMSVQVEAGKSPLWVFTTKDNQMVKLLGPAQRATATFTAKGHDLFASLQGTLHHHNDRATIDRLWNRSVAGWYEGGKDDPNLELLRFDATDAEIWENQNSVLAGVKVLLGADPKKEAQDKMAKVSLRQ
jgi:general stress protein 26